MTNSETYSGLKSRRFNSSLSSGYLLLIILGLFIFGSPLANAQDETLYDEISVYVKLPHIGVGEIDALIRDEDVYLSVTGLFDFIKIRNFILFIKVSLCDA